MSQTRVSSSVVRMELSTKQQNGIIERFAGTVRFPTLSAQGVFPLGPFFRLREYSAVSWPGVFQSPEIQIETHGGASLLLKWSGRDLSLKPVMLTAHQDVVPVGSIDDWTYPPFAGEIADGRVWGRGTVDYKCGFSGMIEAVSLLSAAGFKPVRTVFLAFGHDEEVGGSAGAGSITDSLISRGIRCSSVLDEGGYIYNRPDGGREAVLAIAEKGYASFKLTARAAQGHASVPTGRTAIGILARAVVALEEAEMPLQKVPGEIRNSRWLNTTIAPTVIAGGCKENVLPGSAEVIVNTRPGPGTSIHEVRNFICSTTESFGIEVELIRNNSVSEPSAVADTQTADFRAIKASILNNINPGTEFRCGVFPAATDSRRYSLITDNTYRFMPVKLDHRGIGVLHSVDESISIEDYLNCVNFYAEYISRVST